MIRTRYREARTLVRALYSLPGEGTAAFRAKINLLRQHFVQFNRDVSDICQWLIGLRPGGKKADERSLPFWQSLLDPTIPDFFAQEITGDELRLMLVEAATGWKEEKSLQRLGLSTELRDSIRYIISLPNNKSAMRILNRLQSLERPHQAILLKAATEWVNAKYARVAENRQRQFEEWQKEKLIWESNHPELNSEAIARFNDIFNALDVRIKRPRICRWAKLKEAKDNCDYAGERINLGNTWATHSPLCKKFRAFLNLPNLKKYPKKNFVTSAAMYLQIRYTQRQLPEQRAMDLLFMKEPMCREWFPGIWKDYLKSLEITEETIHKQYSGTLPHCTDFAADKECTFTPHTNLCIQYKDLLKQLPSNLLDLEGTYRDWRAKYLVGPKKPDFRYPSSKSLPTPKIFGKGFFRVDFDQSVLGLRLEGMPHNTFIELAFEPWPADYDLQPKNLQISSVQINFVGTRARAGFRFDIPHAPSRFGLTQDELDELRSRKYPRPSQDAEFLAEARQRLFSTFHGNLPDDLRILAVDLGSSESGAVVFRGQEVEKSLRMKIIKIDRLYDHLPKPAPDKKVDKMADVKTKKYLGLGKDHVGRHLSSLSIAAGEISSRRQIAASSGLADHDLRRLKSHIRWMLRDWVRLNAAQIIDAAVANKVDLILFESLRGFRAPGYDKIDPEKKNRLAFFAYGRIRRKVTEKAVERGMRVITVPYFYSSQFCSNCGTQQQDKKRWNRNKRARKFQCEYSVCQFTGNSDENAARVLAKVFYGKITLPSQ